MGASTPLIVACLAILIGVSDSATAQEFEKAAPVQSFRFDTNDGYYQTWSGSISCPVNAIRGIAHFERYGRPTTQWHPGITVFVRAGTRKSERHVRLAFHAMQYHPPFQVDLDSGEGDFKATGHRTFDIQVGANSTFSFLMSWNASGQVAATVGGEVHGLQIGVRPDHVEINGSTGAASVAFQLGHVSEGKSDECKPVA